MPADFLTGIFAINKKTFFELAPTGNHFDLETELFGKAMKESKKLAQVPISYKKSNKSNLNPLKDGFRIFTVLISNKYVNG